VTEANIIIKKITFSACQREGNRCILQSCHSSDNGFLSKLSTRRELACRKGRNFHRMQHSIPRNVKRGGTIVRGKSNGSKGPRNLALQASGTASTTLLSSEAQLRAGERRTASPERSETKQCQLRTIAIFYSREERHPSRDRHRKNRIKLQLFREEGASTPSSNLEDRVLIFAVRAPKLSTSFWGSRRCLILQESPRWGTKGGT